MNRSLRQARLRLTALVVAVFFSVAAAASAGAWLVVAHAQYAAVDSTLTNQAQALLAGLQDANGQVSFDGGGPLPDVTADGIGVGVVLFDSSGHAVAKAGSMPPASSLSALIREAQQHGQPTVGTVSTLRVLVQPMPASSGMTGVLAVSRTVGEMQQTMLLLGLVLGGALVLLTLMVGVLAYAAAARAMRPVRAMTATLQQFTADAAHELRAPLAVMRAELETSLAHPRTQESYRESQRAVLAEAERLGALTDQLLMLARSDAGALQLQLRDLDLGDLVDETVARWQPVARTADVSLAADITAETTAYADELLLRRLLDNLVDNAIRHTPAGGHVGVGLQGSGSECTLSVADSGPGIPPDQRAALFERFTRGDTARGRVTGGAGLGLALCSVIVELHHGTFGVADNHPGAVFRVQLPLSERPGRSVAISGAQRRTQAGTQDARRAR